jgi:hypothetical protein
MAAHATCPVALRARIRRCRFAHPHSGHAGVQQQVDEPEHCPRRRLRTAATQPLGKWLGSVQVGSATSASSIATMAIMQPGPCVHGFTRDARPQPDAFEPCDRRTALGAQAGRLGTGWSGRWCAAAARTRAGDLHAMVLFDVRHGCHARTRSPLTGMDISRAGSRPAR